MYLMCDANNNKKIDGPDAQDEPKTFVTDVYAIGVTLWARQSVNFRSDE